MSKCTFKCKKCGTVIWNDCIWVNLLSLVCPIFYHEYICGMSVVAQTDDEPIYSLWTTAWPKEIITRKVFPPWLHWLASLTVNPNVRMTHQSLGVRCWLDLLAGCSLAVCGRRTNACCRLSRIESALPPHVGQTRHKPHKTPGWKCSRSWTLQMK